MSETTNGELLKKINDSVIRLETQNIAVTGVLIEIKNILIEADKKCDKTCETNQNRFGKLFTHVKIQWWFIGAIAVGIFTLAFFILRKAFT